MFSLSALRVRLAGNPRCALIAALCAARAAPAGIAQEPAAAAPPASAAPKATEQAPRLSAEQLESLVAPIALYPDPLLAQVLVASTYPLDVVQAQQWLAKNSTLK